MVARYVYLKFKPEFGSEDALNEVAEKAAELPAQVPQIRRIAAGRPADDLSRGAWDLVLVVEFDSPDDIEPYRVHPVHVAYYQEFLKPRLIISKAWNFIF